MFPHKCSTIPLEYSTIPLKCSTIKLWLALEYKKLIVGRHCIAEAVSSEFEVPGPASKRMGQKRKGCDLKWISSRILEYKLFSILCAILIDVLGWLFKTYQKSCIHQLEMILLRAKEWVWWQQQYQNESEAKPRRSDKVYN